MFLDPNLIAIQLLNIDSSIVNDWRPMVSNLSFFLFFNCKKFIILAYITLLNIFQNLMFFAHFGRETFHLRYFSPILGAESFLWCFSSILGAETSFKISLCATSNNWLSILASYRAGTWVDWHLNSGGLRKLVCVCIWYFGVSFDGFTPL